MKDLSLNPNNENRTFMEKGNLQLLAYTASKKSYLQKECQKFVTFDSNARRPGTLTISWTP